MSWGFTANFADNQVRTQNTRNCRERGFYKVRLVDCEFYEKDTHNRAMLLGRIEEPGPHYGAVIRTGMNVPTKFTEDKKARFFLGQWKALVLSVGKQADKKVKLTWATFKGMEAYCEFIPRATPEDWDETLWLTKAQFEDFKANEARLDDDEDIDDVEEYEDDDEEVEDEVTDEDDQAPVQGDCNDDEEAVEAAPKTTKRRRRKAPTKSDPLADAMGL